MFDDKRTKDVVFDTRLGVFFLMTYLCLHVNDWFILSLIRTTKIESIFIFRSSTNLPYDPDNCPSHRIFSGSVTVFDFISFFFF